MMNKNKGAWIPHQRTPANKESTMPGSRFPTYELLYRALNKLLSMTIVSRMKVYVAISHATAHSNQVTQVG